MSRVTKEQEEAIDEIRLLVCRAGSKACFSALAKGEGMADQYRAECAEALQWALKAFDNPVLAGMLGRLP